MVEENKTEQNAEEKTPEQSEAEMLRAKISELEDNLSQLKDQLLRKAAEFDNYKKRVENDYASMVKFANEELISAVLPVLDDFHRSIKMSQGTTFEEDPSEPNNREALLRGMGLIYNKLMKILESQGVKTFDSLGKPFDPYYHDALLQVPKNDIPPHTVIEEVEKGYLLHDKVIRHAKVIVSGEAKSSEEISKTTGQLEPGENKGEVRTN